MTTVDFYDKEQVDDLLENKADAADVYTKTEANTLLGAKANSADVYTKAEADSLLGAKADSADVYDKTEVYTKTEVNTAISNIKQPVIASLASLGDTALDGFKYALTHMSAGATIEATTITDGTNSAYAVEINARQVLTPPLSGRYYFQCNGTISVGGNFYNLYQCDYNTTTGVIYFYYINGSSAANVAMTPTSVADGFFLHY